jgi:hypothetical protein
MEIEILKTSYCRWENNIKADYKHKQRIRVPYNTQKLWGIFGQTIKFLIKKIK